jgi:hypothetical protein
MSDLNASVIKYIFINYVKTFSEKSLIELFNYEFQFGFPSNFGSFNSLTCKLKVLFLLFISGTYIHTRHSNVYRIV